VEDEPDFGYGVIRRYLVNMAFPLDSTSQQRKDIKHRNIPFILIDDTLYRRGRDGILRRVVDREEARIILPQCHEEVYGGYFVEDTTARKILSAGYFWPSLFKDHSSYYKSYPTYQAYRRRLFSHTELNPVFPTGPFKK
jgi:hypothetical protein